VFVPVLVKLSTFAISSIGFVYVRATIIYIGDVSFCLYNDLFLLISLTTKFAMNFFSNDADT
jgi:hypothetical protein